MAENLKCFEAPNGVIYTIVRHPSFPSWVVKASKGFPVSDLQGQFLTEISAEIAIKKCFLAMEDKEQVVQARKTLHLKQQDYLYRKQKHADKKAKQGS